MGASSPLNAKIAQKMVACGLISLHGLSETSQKKVNN
jgi:hypothetical protein